MKAAPVSEPLRADVAADRLVERVFTVVIVTIIVATLLGIFGSSVAKVITGLAKFAP